MNTTITTAKTPPLSDKDRRATDVHVEVSDETEQIADAIRAAGLKLATALPDAEVLRAEVRSLPLSALALRLPEWAAQVTRAQTPTTNPSHLLEQVCEELEGPVRALREGRERFARHRSELPAVRFGVEVARASERLQRLSHDLRDLARLLDGNFASADLHFRVKDTIEAAVDAISPQAQSSDSALRVRFGEGVPRSLVGDPGRLRQVVHSLLGTALKGASGDTIELLVVARPSTDRRVELIGRVSRIGGDGRPVGLRRARRDTGPWLGGPRTGLSLSISRQLVTRMGGRTWVESADGGGRVLNFSLSCRLAEASSGAWLDVRLPERPRILILAPAAEPVVSLVRALEALSAQVDAVHDASTAWGRVRSAPGTYDALFLAASLSSRRGLALAEGVASWPTRPPVVLAPRAAHRGDGQRCRDLGFAGYLPRPLEPGEVRDTLRALAEPSREHQLVTRHFLRETGAGQRSASRPAAPRSADIAVTGAAWSGALERAGGDVALARELAEAFASHAPVWLDTLDSLDARTGPEGVDEGLRLSTLDALRQGLALLNLRAGVQLCDHAARVGEHDELRQLVLTTAEQLRESSSRRRYSGRTAAPGRSP